MITAVALCPAPPLLARELTGQAEILPDLRDACTVAVARLVAAAPDVIVVVGPGDLTATWDPAGQLDLTAFAPALARPPTPDALRGAITRARAAAPAGERLTLPLALGIGARLLDKAGYDGPRALWSIAGSAAAAECVRLGQDLAAPAERVALLVMGDGSARRSVSAPGYLDERAEPFDTEVERAVREGDMPALAALDPALAHELMVSGRPAWQVLAAALGDAGLGNTGLGNTGLGVSADDAPRVEILYSGAPFGVAYLVAALSA
jgi:hypothetical protein